jgi:hypothetical protein
MTVGNSDFSSLTPVLMPQFATVHQSAQMINDRPARVFAVIIEAADVHEVIEAQFLREFAHFDDSFRVGQLDCDFAAKLRRFGD